MTIDEAIVKYKVHPDDRNELRKLLFREFVVAYEDFRYVIFKMKLADNRFREVRISKYY